MRRLSIILAIVLALLVAAALYLLNWLRQPNVVQVPVAVDYIPAGSTIDDSQFRWVDMANIDRETQNTWVTADRFPKARGKVVNSDVRAGFPLALGQIDPSAEGIDERRLSLSITNSNEFYMPIALNPDQIGNFIQVGDYIDIIISLGGISANEKRDIAYTITPTLPGAEGAPTPRTITLTTQMPVSKLIMQNIKIIRVERAQQQSSGNNPAPQRTVQDVKRIYVAVNREQLEVLSFTLNNGARNYAVRSARGDASISPTEGVAWADFVKWFYAQRGNQVEQTSFDVVSNYSPTIKTK